MTGKVTQTCTLSYGDGGSPETFTAVPGTAELQLPGHEVGSIDMSSTDGAVGAFEPGKPKVQPISGSLNFDPDNAPQVQLRTDLLARTKRNWRLTLTDTSPDTTVTFEAFITTFGPIQASDDDKLSCPITLQPTGTVTWA